MDILSVLPLSINTWNLGLLVYTGTTDLLSGLLLGPSSYARVRNIATYVCWVEFLEQQTFEKCHLRPHLKHSISFTDTLIEDVINCLSSSMYV